MSIFDCVDYDNEKELKEIYAMSDKIESDFSLAMEVYHEIGKPEILTEAAEGFFASIIEFFKSLFTAIKDFFTKIFKFLRSLFISSDAYMKEAKESLSKLEFEPFEMEGFVYTIDTNIPKIDYIHNLVSTFNAEQREVVRKQEKMFVSEMKDKYNDEYYNKLRATTLGMNGNITDEDFVEACKNIYRNGTKEKTNLKISKSDIEKYISEYEDLRKVIKDVQKESNDLTKFLGNVIDFFKAAQNSSRSFFRGKQSKIDVSDKKKDGSKFVDNKDAREEVEFSSGMAEILSSFYKFKHQQSRIYYSISNKALKEKINAIKEATAFYKKATSKAFSINPEKKDKEKK